MSAKVVSVTSVGGHFCHHSALAWSEDNRILLSTVKGLHILEPQFKAGDTSGTINYHRYFVPAPERTCSFDVDISREVLHDKLHRESLYALMLDRSLSPSVASSQSFKGYRVACWSPKISDDGERCLLATMTSDHRVQILRAQEKSWKPVVELSTEFLNYLGSRDYVDCKTPSLPDENLPDADAQLHRFIQRTYTCAANEMVWTRTFRWEIENLASSSSKEDIPYSETHFLALIVCMKSGHVVIWKVSSPCLSRDNARVLHVFDPGLGQISALAWQQINQKSGLLAIGSHLGQIQIFLIIMMWSDQSSSVAVDCKMVYSIWDEDDKISVSQIGFKKNADSSYFVLAGKGSYLIGCEFVVADALFIFRHHAYCVGSHLLPLTGICESQDLFVATSGDGCLQTIKMEVSDTGLAVKPQKVQLEGPTSSAKKTLMGICKSPSGIFVAYVGRLLGYIDHLVVREPIDITVFTVHTVTEAVSLMLSHTGPLCQVIDALTYIHISMMDGESCPLEFQELTLLPKEHLKDRSDYILKLVRWLLKLQNMQLISEQDITGTNEEKFKIVEEELVKRQLLKILRSAGNLTISDTTEEIQKIVQVASSWLTSKTTLMPGDQRLINRLSSECNINVNGDGASAPCPVCKEQIPLDNHRSATCPNGHIFGRCCLTLRICDKTTYYKCANCDALALKSVWFVGTRCTYCDGELK